MEKRSALSDFEQRRRREALAAADRSCDIEGLPPVPAFVHALHARWASGEWSMAQVIAGLDQKYRARR